MKYYSNFCQGCGAVMQEKDESKVGYVVDISNHKLCKNCFNLLNYSKVSTSVERITNQKVMNIIESLDFSNSNIFLVVDFLNIEFKIPTNLLSLKSKTNIFVIVNKFDIVPKSLKYGRINEFVKRSLSELKYNDIIYYSARKNLNVDRLSKLIMESSNINNYFIGFTNVGKSSVLNSLMKLWNTKRERITVSELPGTTIGDLKVKIRDKFIIDLPGINNDKSIDNHLELPELRLVNILKEIKPINYSIHSNEVIFIDNLAKITSQSSVIKKVNYQFYFSENISFHKTTIKNLDKNMNNLKFKLKPKKLERTLFSLPNDKLAYDIIICDFGRIRTIALGQKIEIFTPFNVKPLLKKSFIINYKIENKL